MDERWEKFLDVGFLKVGEWKLNGVNLNCELTEKDPRGSLLCAFTSGERMLFLEYSRWSLEASLDAYIHTDHRYAATFQPANRRVRERIINMLEDGFPVEIWAFHPEEETHFKGLRVDLALGLYDSLVKVLAPEWKGA
jgi:hypothetical protein